jgi:adenosine deaminase
MTVEHEINSTDGSRYPYTPYSTSPPKEFPFIVQTEVGEGSIPSITPLVLKQLSSSSKIVPNPSKTELESEKNKSTVGLTEIPFKLIDKITHNTAVFFDGVVLKNEQVLKHFIKIMPKGGDLHLHIDGSIHSRELLNMAVIKDLFCRVIGEKFEFGTKKEFGEETSETIFSARSLQQDSSFLSLRTKFYELVSMRGAFLGVKSGHHKHFFRAFKTLESIAQHMHLKEKLTLLLLNTNESIRYLEPSIWFDKEKVPSEFKIEFDTVFSRDSFDVVEAKRLVEMLSPWVTNYIKNAIEILDECKQVTDSRLLEKGFNKDDLFDNSNPQVVRFIIDNDRTTPCLATVFAHFVGSMVLQMEDDRVVGSGFAGEEHDDSSINHYDDHMRIIKVLKKCFPDTKLSLHAGELIPELSQTREPIETHVRKAVEAGADRVGHAVCSTDDPKFLQLLSMMKEINVHVECCIKSNKNVLGISNGTHPIQWFIKKGVPFSFCTDDQGVNNSSLADEIFEAAKRYSAEVEPRREGRRLGYLQIKQASLNSIRNSFLPGESIYEGANDKGIVIFKDAFADSNYRYTNLREIISSCLNEEGEWTQDILNACTTEQQLFFASSEKAQMELEVEMDFIYFEQVVIPKLQKEL